MKLLKYGSVASLAFIFGLVAASFAAKAALPYAMFKETQSRFDHDRTVEVIKQSIAHQTGWKLMAAFDQQKAILDGGGEDPGRFDILKFCHSGHASDMLADDARRHFGVMMPVSVAVYEKSDGRTYVALVNGSIISRVFGGEYERILRKVRTDMEEMYRFMHLDFDVLD